MGFGGFIPNTPPSTAPWGKDQSDYNGKVTALLTSTDDFIKNLVGIDFQAPKVQLPPIIVSQAPTISTAKEPSLIDVTWNTPQQPAAFGGTLSVADLFPGEFEGLPPALNFGSPPAPFNAPAPAAPPIDLNFQYPTPTVNLPSLPSLLSLDTVAFDDFVVPQFNVAVPQLVLAIPNIVPYKEGAPFTSTLLASLQDDLLRAMEEGTWTGLPGPIETNLFDRAREREYRQQADALLELERMESLGYAFPPGVYIDARVRMQTETANTISGLSRDIMVKQAELTLQNITEARKISVELESKLIDYQTQMYQRALESAKFVTEASIGLYNAAVAAYSANLKGYEVQATVYDTQIKGLLAQVDIVKAKIEFENTKAQINTALVEQYKAEVDASLASVEIYKLQVQIIQTEAEIEKIKVDVYGAQIQAYTAQINSYTAQVEAYKAQVQAQGEIEQVYKIQSEVYATEVDAAAKQADAIIAEFRGQIDAYTAQLSGYKAALDAMVAQAQAASLYNEAQAKVFEAEAQALASYNNTLTSQWQATINEQIQAAQVGVAVAEANGKLYIATEQLVEDAAKTAAQVYAQLTSATIGSVHWANNANWSASNAFNYNYNNSTSDDTIHTESA
jgi:hypothetical protein